MSIIPDIYTVDQKLEAKQLIVTRLNSMYSRLLLDHTSLYNSIWNNPILSPQEALDALDGKAYWVFLASLKLQEALKSMNPDYEMLTAPVQVTFSENGDATIIG